MKTLRVAAAVICNSFSDRNRIFATAKGYGRFKGQWEFPGGKIEKGETPKQALVREIHEELDVNVRVGDLIHTVEYDYPDFYLSMDCFWCEVNEGTIKLVEAPYGRWLSKEELFDVPWLSADIELIKIIEKNMK